MRLKLNASPSYLSLFQVIFSLLCVTLQPPTSRLSAKLAESV